MSRGIATAVLMALTLTLLACSPEVDRTRGGGPGADIRNVSGIAAATPGSQPVRPSLPPSPSPVFSPVLTPSPSPRRG